MSSASRAAEGGPVHLYAIGLGANRALSRMLGPAGILAAAFAALDEAPLRLVRRSHVIASRPLGPSRRTYANAAAIVAAPLPPLAMLDHLQAIERRFGRKRHRRWGARTLDLDLLLWSGGAMRGRHLTIPHAALADRAFVLRPLREIAPGWRVPGSGLTVRQLAARLDRPQPAR